MLVKLKLAQNLNLYTLIPFFSLQSGPQENTGFSSLLLCALKRNPELVTL